MDNWVNGDYVITRSWNGVDEYTESLCIYHEGHGQSVLRKAVLDDFAVEIPEYGKVWFMEEKSGVVMHLKDKDDWYMYMRDFNRSIFLAWELKALISHYNITVMPEALWQELRK